jgi:hypothetical protein
MRDAPQRNLVLVDAGKAAEIEHGIVVVFGLLVRIRFLARIPWERVAGTVAAVVVAEAGKASSGPGRGERVVEPG